jgi:type IV pilus assembly protein PilA
MKKNQEKMNNKGFSLVELIIVIAIMAILVGVVGTQVIPYLNKSREAKDQQFLSSYATAAVTAYTENAEKLTTADATVNVYTSSYTDAANPFEAAVQKSIQNLTYDDKDTALKKFSSKKGQAATDIQVIYKDGEVTVSAVGSNLDVVTSAIGDLN